MKTYTRRIRLSYPDFADEAPNDFSNLPGLIRLVRAGGGNPGQVDSKIHSSLPALKRTWTQAILAVWK